MRQLKNLNVHKSINTKSLIFEENFGDKLDRITIYLFFTYFGIMPYLYADFSKDNQNIYYFISSLLSLFCLYVVYRKATEKNLNKIETFNSLEINREIINNYCKQKGYQKQRNSNNILIYIEENPYTLSNSYHTSRIFLLDNNDVYFTIIKDNFRLNIPVLISQIILKSDMKKIFKK
ncbi:hypothetical protein FSS13T_22600 [Flavobacterium saliperosum S13]|uniref:Uncharacterized protein n=2 Tax=Flavobacterium saliperosum TaxID=329186 RepID=A0A1G4VP63_9FLAO|nr:hypothetical protein [Flavobacterium saliperosum]ESU23533.1 hypothetical protein FSS13T_22600 [Flavobacterium saliperosum S13]SCX09730.1 hypothetical protein SAMN02927925_01436 [Flavobacterium saliperosum]